jgi:hypothetical protein
MVVFTHPAPVESPPPTGETPLAELEFDSLWVGQATGRRWTDRLTPDALQWLDDLAEYIVVKGSAPIWSKVHVEFTARWPEHKVSRQTLSDSVKRFVTDKQAEAKR